MYDKFRNYRVRVFTKNDCFFEGTLLKTDNYRNHLIDDCEEFKEVKTFLNSPRLYLGLVMIPGKTVKYIEYLYKIPKTL